MYVLDAPCRRETRKAPNLTPHLLLFVASATIEVAAIGAVVEQVSQGGGIWDTNVFRLCCLIGGLGGAVISLLFAEDMTANGSRSGIKPMARKLICSSISGWAFTAPVMGWFAIPLKVDNVVGTSCAVAIAAVAVLQGIAAVWAKYGIAWIERRAASIAGPLDHPKQ